MSKRKKKSAKKAKKSAKKGKRKSAKRAKAGKKSAAKRRRKKAAKAKASKKSRKRSKRSKAKAAPKRRRRRSKKARKGGKRKHARRARKGGKRKHARKAKRHGGKRKHARKAKRRGGKRRTHKVRIGRSVSLTVRMNKRRKHHRRMRSNLGDFGAMQRLLVKGGFVVLGFFGHKALTGVALEVLETPVLSRLPAALDPWKKPLVGLVVGAGQVWLTGMLVKDAERRNLLNTGAAVSFLQNLVMTGLRQLGGVQGGKIADRLEGADDSRAYNLQGFGEQVSIGPRYAMAPTGEYFSGQGGMGEYFSGGAAGLSGNGVGEYFASNGVEGVGQYEKAGPLVLQAAAGGYGAIEDGIRPDGDMDSVMDLMDSASGFGGGYMQAAAGMGQGYMQAAAGFGGPGYMQAAAGFGNDNVGEQSTWIPSGPLIAGERSADDSQGTSELPAGILQGGGGQGILS